MHRAKGDRFVRASELPVCDNVLVSPIRGFLELRFISVPTVYNHVACQCLLLVV